MHYVNMFFRFYLKHFIPSTTTFIKILICAIPAKFPVINLLTFVDSFILLYWIYQSKNISNRKPKSIKSGILIAFIHSTIPMIWPVSIPVHLLHIGNCHPLIWKLLSSLWWQPHRFPNRIKNAQVFIFVLFFIKIDSHNHYKY